MKNLFLAFILSLFYFAASAQGYGENTTVYIKNYSENAAVSLLPSNKLRIQNGDKVGNFNLVQKENIWQLEHPKDSTEILKILNINHAVITEALQHTNGSTFVDKLIYLAHGSKNNKLILSSDTTTTAINTAMEDDEELSSTPTPTNTQWWIPLAIGVGALVLGFFFGRVSKKSAVTKTVEDNKAAATTSTEQKLKANTEALIQAQNNEAKLKAELVQLQEKYDQVATQLKEFIENDRIYFTAAFDKILLPIQKALDDENKSDVVKYTHLAMIHLSSITRVKLRKKQNYDDANIQLLIGNSSATKEFPEVDFQMSLDKIPANLRVLMEILEAHQVKSLDDAIVKGYKIKG